MLGSEDAYFEFSGAVMPESDEPVIKISNGNKLDLNQQGTGPANIMQDASVVYDVSDPAGKAGFSYETDPVQQQFGTVEGIEFPCVYIICKPEDLQLHRLNTLNVLATSLADETRYPLYLEVGTDISGLGTIDSHSLKTLLTSSLFTPWKVFIRTSKTDYYDDDMRLAFCS